MAAYYHVLRDRDEIDREIVLGFHTYERLFRAARQAGAVLLVRCGSFHGMDEFRLHELDDLRAEIARVKSVATGVSDVVQFLDALGDLASYAASRGKSVIADAD